MASWKYYDPNADYKSKLSEGQEDCIIRALMIVSGEGWLECFDKAVQAARALRTMPDTWDALNTVLYRDYDMIYTPLEREAEITAAAFCRQNPAGVFVLDFPGHVAPVVDGVIYDADNSGRRKVCGYWQKK